MPQPTSDASSDADGIWQPAPGTTWQLQLQGDIQTVWDVDVYEIDLYDAPQATIDALHADGRKVICYFSGGTHEDWRDDADQFPDEVIGKALPDWPGERWLDVRAIDALSGIMGARLDLAVEKRCDAVEPDNVDAYANDSGFPLTADDQLRYNRWLADQAHQRGLAIGLKNALELVSELVDDFEFATNEQCFEYKECHYLQPFIDQGKAVFGVEYELDPSQYCLSARAMHFSFVHKTYDLGDEPPNACE